MPGVFVSKAIRSVVLGPPVGVTVSKMVRYIIVDTNSVLPPPPPSPLTRNRHAVRVSQ